MKAIRNNLIFIFFLISTAYLYSQIQFVTSNNSLIYNHLPNTVYFFYDGDFDSIYLSSSNGTLMQENKYSYIWSPEKSCESCVEYGILKMYKILELDTITLGSFSFKIHDIPQPSFFFAGKNGGKITVDEILKVPLSQIHLISDFYPYDLSGLGYRFEEFSYIIISKKKTQHFNKKNSNVFTNEEVEKFKDLKQGDIIIFYNISVLSNYSDTPIKISPCEFFIE